MIMAVVTHFRGFLILLLFLLSGSRTNSCPAVDNKEKSLKDCLTQNYSKSVRPAPAANALRIAVEMFLRFIEMDEHYHTLTIHTWLSWTWTDIYLKWSPADYDNIKEISIASDDIWTPDVTLLTTKDASMHQGIPSTYCKVNNFGIVHCIPPTTLFAYCAPDLSLWPFDTQSCTLEIGSWFHYGDTINTTLDGKGYSTNYLLPNKIWELKNVSAKNVIRKFSNGLVHPILEYTFELKRHALGHAATAVIPAFVLAVLTLLTFLLDPESSERTAMLGCSLLGHILFLQYMSWAVPPNGDTVPNLVVFFRDSLLLVGGSFVVTVCVQMILRTQISPPVWLTATIGGVLATPPGQIFLLGRLSARGAAASSATSGEDGDTLVSNDTSPPSGGGRHEDRHGDGVAWKETHDAWRLAAVFVDRLSLAVFCLALLFLFGRYVA